MRVRSQFTCWRAVLLAALVLIHFVGIADLSPLHATDRTTFIVPQSNAAPPIRPVGMFPDQAFDDHPHPGWQAYQRVWKAHASNPASAAIRRYLGLPLEETVDARPRRGSGAPSWLGWRPGSYQKYDTRHYTIYSRASPAASKQVASDLEACYWIWTQMFFPMWEGSAQVATQLRDLNQTTSVEAFLESGSTRITVSRKMRVVLFRDAGEYQKTLGAEIPGIEQSTGFYADANQTVFLYGSEQDDPATRRHESVHQLFREATRSGLGRDQPGEREGFWLVEGIAGYFESLSIGEQIATVGGWDASRLQFARYRVLLGGDFMPLAELQRDGRLAAQRRDDLARYYAHAIAQTHQLLDGPDRSSRWWVYHQLAELYKIRIDLPAGQLPASPERSLREFLTIDDTHLRENRLHGELRQLCLAGCQVGPEGLATIPATESIQWLDLSRMRTVDNDAVTRLAPKPAQLAQLTLEATAVDSGLADWLRQASRLRELDLSWTQCDDQTLAAIPANAPLEVLWMTGSKVSDRSIVTIARMPRLQSVDLQRTAVTEAGLQRLKSLRPQLEINPLELR